eukprot:1152224-Prymnesium_polylepis.1
MRSERSSCFIEVDNDHPQVHRGGQRPSVPAAPALRPRRALLPALFAAQLETKKDVKREEILTPLKTLCIPLPTDRMP